MEEVIKMDYLQVLMAFLAFSGQIGVLLLVIKMINFANKYGKPWANAFKIFFLAMFICWLRRFSVFLITLRVDLWGHPWDHLQDLTLFYDRYVSNPILTGLYLIFLIMLVRWWKHFFSNIYELITQRENAVGKRESEVSEREDVIKKFNFVAPNGAVIKGMRRVVVDVEEKKVDIEKPEEIIVVNPKKVEEEIE